MWKYQCGILQIYVNNFDYQLRETIIIITGNRKL